MKTAGDYRAEAQSLRELAKDMSDPDILAAIRDMIDELEARARAMENGV